MNETLDSEVLSNVALIENLDSLEKVYHYDHRLILKGSNVQTLASEFKNYLLEKNICLDKEFYLIQDAKTESTVQQLKRKYKQFPNRYYPQKKRFEFYFQASSCDEVESLVQTKNDVSVVKIPVFSKTAWQIQSLFQARDHFREEVLTTRRAPLREGSIRYSTLEFCGATRFVGASGYLLETSNETRVLLDCGLGFGQQKFPVLSYPYDTINYVVLSHSHSDHCLYLPLLVKEGFRGTIYASKATFLTYYNICKEYLFTQKNFALFTLKDLQDSLFYFKVVEPKEKVLLEKNLQMKLIEANHCLGSTMCAFKFRTFDRRIHRFLYTGDFKNKDDRFYRKIDLSEVYDTILCEGTYGPESQRSPKHEEIPKVCALVYETLKKGSLLIPIFSNRGLEFLYYFMKQLSSQVKSKLVISESIKNTLWLAFDCRNSFSKTALEGLKSLRTMIEQLPTLDRDYSLKLFNKVILTPSGMLEGGGSTMVLKQICEDENNCILFTGFLSKNSLGRRVYQAPMDTILPTPEAKSMPQKIKIKCRRESTRFLSAHSNFSETEELLQKLCKKNSHVYLVHGEESTLVELKNKLTLNKKVTCRIKVPFLRQRVRLF